MAYGTLKCDNIVFDNGGTDKLVTVSGLFFSTSGALTVTGTISGGNVTAPAATFTTLTGTTTAGTTALLVSIAVSADKVTAFGATTTSVFVSINGQDLQAAITALQAEVAALKADYNALAAKWNARVASKKAPKKAVTLK